ncbi:hypothetical protein OXPF_06130 [Oxobacter pfennigii]|uniref:Major tropism determinant N-terminal domain-containing protein n=1 Tax=Oxobacter pfennigii TaxID=36849 RepID=A0A0N8NTU7_9CLOT|nr:hypothetical protein [Oxobacter pfennigii]KPU45824.1 hypothetical protein OXPF_06130 [Oxobacter pfennigii]
MARKILIQIRRGLEADIGSLTAGELGYCTDTNKLYIGTASGNMLLVAAQTAGDMLKSIYDTDNDGKVDTAEAADSVPWAGVSGKKVFPESSTEEAPLSIPHGAAPASPVNGDMWTTTSGLYLRLNGTTRTMAHTATWSTVSQAEAEAGTATSQRLWTAQRVAQAVAAQAMPKGPITWNELKGV